MTTWDADKGPSEEQVDDALRVLRADYWTSIRGMAKSIADEMRAGDLAPADADDRVHEVADGSYWTIYTHANYRAIMCSDANPFDLAEDEGFELDPNSLLILPTLAYLCVRHDLREQLETETRAIDVLADEDEEG